MFFQCFNQTGFGETRRRLGKMLFAKKLVERNGFTFSQWRQLAAFLFLAVVRIFLIHGDKAGKHQRLSAGAEQRVVAAETDVEADSVEAGRRHLTCQRAFPDHFIQPGLIYGEVATNAVRRTCNGGGANRFVSLLSIFGFTFVGRNRFW